MAMYRALFFGGEESPAQALRLVTRHSVSLGQQLPTAYEQRIEQAPGVQAVMMRQWFGGVYKDARDPNNNFGRIAVEPAKFFALYPEMKIAPDQRQAFEQERTACVATKPLADRLGWKAGERITIVGDIFPVTLDLTLVGTFDDPSGFDAIYFNWNYLRDSLPASENRDMVQIFVVQAKSTGEAAGLGKTIDAMFDNSPYPARTELERAFALSFVSFLGNVKLFLLAICGAVAFTVLLVSANTISMSVRERIREVGVMKTLGFLPSEILGIILSEAALTALVGGALGCLLAVGLCAAVRNMNGVIGYLKTMSVTPLIVLICLSVAVAIGLLSALLPALTASRRSILEALLHTG